MELKRCATLSLVPLFGVQGFPCHREQLHRTVGLRWSAIFISLGSIHRERAITVHFVAN
jgi:hypothetical protein